MELRAYAKINLSLNILGARPDGYHNISSLMQNIGLYDTLNIEKCSQSGTKYNFSHCSICKVDVYLCTDDSTIPTGEDNLAVRGAKELLLAFDEKGIAHDIKELWISIEKKLPVAAGIAGGSGNAAVVMLAVNAFAGYPFSLGELMAAGAKVGADVPFSLLMNARMNKDILDGLAGIEDSNVAAMMTGIGDIVEPAPPIHKHIIMANPGVAVSTKDAYEAMDKENNFGNKRELFTNDLEEYTLTNYPVAKQLKQDMQSNLNAEVVLMSGSGPTIVAYYDDEALAKSDYEKMLRDGWLGENGRAWLTETGLI